MREARLRRKWGWGMSVCPPEVHTLPPTSTAYPPTLPNTPTHPSQPNVNPPPKRESESCRSGRRHRAGYTMEDQTNGEGRVKGKGRDEYTLENGNAIFCTENGRSNFYVLEKEIREQIQYRCAIECWSANVGGTYLRFKLFVYTRPAARVSSCRARTGRARTRGSQLAVWLVDRAM